MTDTEQNIQWLRDRGYVQLLDQSSDEDVWYKNGVRISIHSVRGNSPSYFKTLVQQKESRSDFSFDVIYPDNFQFDKGLKQEPFLEVI